MLPMSSITVEMQVNEKPAAVAGPSNVLYPGDTDAEAFALLLDHRCRAWERASGNYVPGVTVWGAGIAATMTCSICGRERKLETWGELSDWLAAQQRKAKHRIDL